MSLPKEFQMRIEFGNSGMRTSAQLIAAIRKVADRIDRNDYPVSQEIEKGIMDANGNTIGEWTIK
jgi:hypothetical protein